MARSYTCPPTSTRHMIAKSVDITAISAVREQDLLEGRLRAAKPTARRDSRADTTETRSRFRYVSGRQDVSPSCPQHRRARVPRRRGAHPRTPFLRTAPPITRHATTKPATHPPSPRPSPPTTRHAPTQPITHPVAAPFTTGRASRADAAGHLTAVAAPIATTGVTRRRSRPPARPAAQPPNAEARVRRRRASRPRRRRPRRSWR